MEKKQDKNHSEMIEMSRGLGNASAMPYYQFQIAREGSMNQIRDLIRRINEGIPFDAPEKKKDKKKKFAKKYEDKNLLPLLRKMLKEEKVTLKQHKYLSDLLALMKRVKSLEGSYKTVMKHFVAEEIIWNEYLSHIFGIGEVISTNLISRLGDCSKFAHVSSLWRYCGLHPICPNCVEERKDDEGKTKKFPVVVDRDGICPKCGARGIGASKKMGRGLDYSPYMKTLMLGKVAECLIRSKSPIYKGIYDNEKAKQKSLFFSKGELTKRFNGYKETDTELSDGHAHNRAKRKVAKIFLQHYWEFARIGAGLPVTKPYVEDKMGHEHIVTWQDILRANGVDVQEDAA